MKVLWFCNNPAMGIEYLSKKGKGISGTGGWLYALDKELKSHVDLHVAFLYPYHVESFKYNGTTYYPIYTGNIIKEKLRKRFLNAKDKSYLASCLAVIRNVCPDVIHIHGTENPFCEIIGNTSIPTIISIQGNLTVYNHKFNAGFYGKYQNCKMSGSNIRSLLFGRFMFKNDKKWFEKNLMTEQQALHECQYIMGRTDWDKRITRILAPKSSYFTGNEILRDSFYIHQWDQPAPSSKIIIHTTNGDTYYKGFETLCHALSLLNRNNVNVEWRVAGVSDNSLINKITKKQLAEIYPQKGLKLLGSLNEFELVDSLKTSHIYVMPSHIENSPNNLCEAMMLGMPCIATFAGGTGSLMHDKIHGLLIQDGDPWAMAGAILELVSNWEVAKQYGQAARKCALLRHDKSTIAKEMIYSYTTITVK